METSVPPDRASHVVNVKTFFEEGEDDDDKRKKKVSLVSVLSYASIQARH